MIEQETTSRPPESVAEIVNRLRGHLGVQPTSSDLEESSCPVCNGTGWELVGDTRAVKPCGCRLRRIAESRLREMLEGWPEYREAKLDSIRPKSSSQAAALERVRANPEGSYYLHGFFSGGKTHLMIAQYQYLALAGVPCLLRSSRQLADEMRKAEMAPIDSQESYESAVLEMLSRPKHCHLFLDDVEKAPARTGFRAESAFYWLDTLKRHCHGLTITSNLELQNLTQYLGDAAVARIDQICCMISL